MTKECSQYQGQAGQFCTITSSNIPWIRAGMRVVYADAANFDRIVSFDPLVAPAADPIVRVWRSFPIPVSE